MTEWLGEWASLFPLFLVGGTGLAVLLLDSMVSENSQLALVAGVALIGTAFVSIAISNDSVATLPEAISHYFRTDRASLLGDAAICMGAGLAALFAGGYLREYRFERGEFYVLLIWAPLGGMALAHSTHFLSFFIALETMSLGTYALVAFRRHSPKAVEGALKYFLLGSFATAIFLFGSALIYAATGKLDFSGIAQGLDSARGEHLRLALIGIVLVLVGLAFKLSAVPFHMWAPDAYEGAPTPTTSYMAVVVKAAVGIGMLRLLMEALHIETLVAGAGSWPELLFWLSALTLVGGNLGAVVQRNVKRMLAYSSIANAGFLLMGIGAASRLEAPLRGDAIAAVFYYILAYTASSSLALGSLIAAGSQGREAVSLSDLAGLGRRHPWIGIPFSLGVLSLMGLPPLAGFFSKYWVLLAAVRAGNDYLTLGIVAVLMSTVGAYYYLRVLVYLFMRTGEEGTPLAVPMRSGYVFSALLIASFFVLQMGITPSPYVRLSHEASKAWEPGPSKDESNNQQIAQASP